MNDDVLPEEIVRQWRRSQILYVSSDPWFSLTMQVALEFALPPGEEILAAQG